MAWFNISKSKYNEIIFAGNETIKKYSIFKILMDNPGIYQNFLSQHPDFVKYLEKFQMAAKNSSILSGSDFFVDEENCVDFNDVYQDPSSSTLAMIIFGVIYGQIFLLGLLGNVSMMFLTLRHRHLQTIQNIFILNLAMSDVIICLLSVPITPITNIFKTWFFGSWICHLLPFVQAVSVFVSTFSLSAIAIDRYNLVARPHANLLNPRGAIIVATILWILAALVSLPYCYFMKLEQYTGYCGQFCTEKWPDQNIRRGYSLILLCCQFLIPFTTMSCCYSAIFSRLKERANSKIKKLDERSQLLNTASAAIPVLERNRNLSQSNLKELSSEDKQIAQLLSKQRRTTTILASMVLIFGLSWLPQNVVTLIIEYDDTFLHTSTTNYTYIVSSIAHCIAMTNNIANPVLYAWLNPSFKNILIKTFWRVMQNHASSDFETTNQEMRAERNSRSVVRLNKSNLGTEHLV